MCLLLLFQVWDNDLIDFIIAAFSSNCKRIVSMLERSIVGTATK
jgi:hypothetical protein